MAARPAQSRTQRWRQLRRSRSTPPAPPSVRHERNLLPPELTDQGVADRIAFLVELIDEVARPHTWTESELRDRADVLTGLVFLSPHLQAPHVRGQVSVERYAELLADLLIAGLRNDKGNEP